MFETTECVKCKGSGQKDRGLAGNDPCDTCGGEGRVVHVRVLSTFDVMLPASSAGKGEPEITREGLSVQAREHFVGTGSGTAVLIHADAMDIVAAFSPAARDYFDGFPGGGAPVLTDSEIENLKVALGVRHVGGEAPVLSLPKRPLATPTMQVNRELWLQTQALSNERGKKLIRLAAAVRAFVDDVDEDRSATFDKMVATLEVAEGPKSESPKAKVAAPIKRDDTDCPGAFAAVSGLIVRGRVTCDDCGRSVPVRNVKNDGGEWTIVGKHRKVVG